MYAKNFKLHYDGYLRQFSRAGYDIGLAPLPDGAFYISKTNNKYREYGACRIAGVYSDVVVYNSCVVDGSTGLLVSQSPGAWYKAIARLVTDRALRERIQAQAFRDIQRRYAQTLFENVWYAQLQSVLSKENLPMENFLTGALQRGRLRTAVARPGAHAALQDLGYERVWHKVQLFMARLRGKSLCRVWLFIRMYWNNRYVMWKLGLLTSPFVDDLSARFGAKKRWSTPT